MCHCTPPAAGRPSPVRHASWYSSQWIDGHPISSWSLAPGDQVRVKSLIRIRTSTKPPDHQSDPAARPQRRFAVVESFARQCSYRLTLRRRGGDLRRNTAFVKQGSPARATAGWDSVFFATSAVPAGARPPIAPAPRARLPDCLPNHCMWVPFPRLLSSFPASISLLQGTQAGVKRAAQAAGGLSVRGQESRDDVGPPSREPVPAGAPEPG